MGYVELVRYEPALVTLMQTKRVLIYITVTIRDPPTPFLSEFAEILAL